jgi:DNA-binding NarL/FixJ family response regulator
MDRPDNSSVPKIRLLVVDDHVVMRMGLVYAASAQPDMEVIAEVQSGEEAIVAYRAHNPDVVVLDLRMPGMNGLDTIKALREEFHGARIVIFSNYARGEEVYQAIRAGAAGFVVKNMNLSQLLEAIRRVHAGKKHIPAELTAKMGERNHFPLSERETEVLALIAKGRSNKEIGAVLGVTEGTVKIHVTNIFSKLNVAARTEALVVAVQRGIIDIPERSA